MPPQTRTTYRIASQRRQNDGWDVVVSPWIDSLGNSWEVFLRKGERDGTFIATSMEIRPSEGVVELTHTTLVELPLRQIIQDAARREVVSKASVSAGRRSSEDVLADVAMIYLDAVRRNAPVQRAVAEALDIPVSTAAKRIMAARNRGLLPKLPNRPKVRNQSTRKTTNPDY